MSIDKLIENIDSRLLPGDFIEAKDLVQAGLFTTKDSVRRALRAGMFPAVKLSSHRVLIPRNSVIDHIRKQLSGVAA